MPHVFLEAIIKHIADVSPGVIPVKTTSSASVALARAPAENGIDKTPPLAAMRPRIPDPQVRSHSWRRGMACEFEGDLWLAAGRPIGDWTDECDRRCLTRVNGEQKWPDFSEGR